MAVPSQYEWIKDLNDLVIWNEAKTTHLNLFEQTNFGWWRGATGTFYPYTLKYPIKEMSICANGASDSTFEYHHNADNTPYNYGFTCSFSKTMITVRITTVGVGQYSVTVENASLGNITEVFEGVYSGEQSYKGIKASWNDIHSGYAFVSCGGYSASGNNPFYWGGSGGVYFDTLENALKQVYRCFSNIILIVDGETWLDPTLTYTWQSVPSISGKNGILSLSQIKASAINDGDPVSGASASDFDVLTDDTLVANLISVGAIDNSKARVVYNIPSGNYSYAKLTYKQNHIPADKDDGTSVDLDISSFGVNKTIDVGGIVDGTTYWFVIFTDKSESDPVQLGQSGSGTTFFEVSLSTDGRDIIRYDASKIVHVEAYYSYDWDYREFDAIQGALTNVDPDASFTISNNELTTAEGYQTLCWAYDVTGNQRIIPANCTLWFNFDVYFPEYVGYLDLYLYDPQMSSLYWDWDYRNIFDIDTWYNCKLELTIENGYITYKKIYVDDTVIDEDEDDSKMHCIDEDNPRPLYSIAFMTTQITKLKNMRIYWE